MNEEDFDCATEFMREFFEKKEELVDGHRFAYISDRQYEVIKNLQADKIKDGGKDA